MKYNNNNNNFSNKNSYEEEDSEDIDVGEENMEESLGQHRAAAGEGIKSDGMYMCTVQGLKMMFRPTFHLLHRPPAAQSLLPRPAPALQAVRPDILLPVRTDQARQQQPHWHCKLQHPADDPDSSCEVTLC